MTAAPNGPEHPPTVVTAEFYDELCDRLEQPPSSPNERLAALLRKTCGQVEHRGPGAPTGPEHPRRDAAVGR